MGRAFVLAAVILCGAVPASFAGRLSQSLADRTKNTNGSTEIAVLVVLRDQAPVANLDRSLREARATRAERHRAVVDALRATAKDSQRSILAELAALWRAGDVRDFTPYWLVNAVAVTTTLDGARSLANRSDVDVIEPIVAVDLLDPVPALSDDETRSVSSIGITPGVVAVQARRVWTELGIDGAGALVANLDTGVDGLHPALGARWRGHFAPVGECWRDAVGFGDATPVDRNAHGTHVMGTICGLAPNDTIGVAPGSLWIADNAINQGVGPAFDVDILGSFQWLADPDGNSATIEDVPDVVQNSWGVNEGLGYLDCDARWWLAIDHCEAAGVVVLWSAGGDGPGAGTLRSPADRASTPFSAFSVGTTLATSPFPVANFSSRGPSGCGGPYAMKPELVAPGVSTYSSVPGGGYQVWSGSAMAGPHVAGVVALMRCADPDVEVDTIKQILMDTATDLGPAGEDNASGHGFVNAFDAVVAVLAGYGRIVGTVTDLVSGDPLSGAQVAIAGDPRATSDASGAFGIPVASGSWTLECSAPGYLSDTRTIDVASHEVADGSFALIPEGTGVAIDASLPSRFELGSPRPSPMESITSIEYSVPPGAGDVSISIYDVAGRRVRALVRGAVAAGRYVVTWDGRDAAGRRAGSGMYFYRMESGTFSQARKVMVLPKTRQ